ncbi:MAG: hypothetical protein IPO98_16500 [Saprospiraceae bacterium]|nr:hypothetical protein [Saprospiraceae bacterium]
MKTYKYTCEIENGKLTSNLLNTSNGGKLQINNEFKDEIDVQINTLKDLLDEATFEIKILDLIETKFDKSTHLNVSFNIQDKQLHLIVYHKTKEESVQIDSDNLFRVKFNKDGHINIDRIYPILNFVHKTIIKLT